jgi:hypothetical protein
MFAEHRPRVFALSLGTALASSLWLALLLAKGNTEASSSPRSGPEVAVEQLVAEGQGIWDGHPDPAVGRVLQPDLVERVAGNIAVSTNSIGLREREFSVPKPAGRLRVLLLGDSYVFGNGVAAEERVGVHLEAELRQRSGIDVEVLHVGMTDWNLLASSAYLRRQLHHFEPDLVVHVLIYNDLDDASAVRGFGAMANWSSQVREHANGLVNTRQPFNLGFGGDGARASLLNAGLDHESRSRYAQARDAMADLRQALAARGARYLAVLHWPDQAGVAHRELFEPLPKEARAYVPGRLFFSAEHRVSAADGHWNPAAQREVAQMLYAAIATRHLLGAAALTPWPEAEVRLSNWEQEALAECAASADPLALRQGEPLRASLRFDAPDALLAAQVHGGLDAQGQAAPYASFVLANGGASELRLEIDRAPGSSVSGRAAVALEGQVVGLIDLAAGPRHLSYPVPAELALAPYINVSLRSDDWVLTGPRQQRCVSLILRSASLGAP